jgi:hypothetical protein
MSSSKPPRLAQWLLERGISGPQREALVGDMLEQYQRGRSAAWYWRQTVSAIAISFTAEISQHKALAAAVTVLGLYLPDIYMFSRVWVWVARFDHLWYRPLINSRWHWMVTDPWAYRLKPYLWTSEIAWCAVPAVVSWILTRLYPRQTGLVLTLLVITQVGQRLPYVRSATEDWIRDPGNPIWLFGLLWFSAITFVAIPASILFAGAAGGRRARLSTD